MKATQMMVQQNLSDGSKKKRKLGEIAGGVEPSNMVSA
jgi:hypothetical protein